jgi:hypothetical protein
MRVQAIVLGVVLCAGTFAPTGALARAKGAAITSAALSGFGAGPSSRSRGQFRPRMASPSIPKARTTFRRSGSQVHNTERELVDALQTSFRNSQRKAWTTTSNRQRGGIRRYPRNDNLDSRLGCCVPGL